MYLFNDDDKHGMASATGVVHASSTSSPELPTSLHQPVDLAGSSHLGGTETRIREGAGGSATQLCGDFQTLQYGKPTTGARCRTHGLQHVRISIRPAESRMGTPPPPLNSFVYVTHTCCQVFETHQ